MQGAAEMWLLLHRWWRMEEKPLMKLEGTSKIKCDHLWLSKTTQYLQIRPGKKSGDMRCPAWSPAWKTVVTK